MPKPSRGYMPPAAREDWCTPEWVLKLANIAFGGDGQKYDGAWVACDPCPSPIRRLWFATSNLALPKADGLKEAWLDGTFVNPPFGDLQAWAEKCRAEAELGKSIILLTPSRTDTRYWQEEIFQSAVAICFLKGRLRFEGAPAPCPFPTSLVYWGEDEGRFREACEGAGKVVLL